MIQQTQFDIETGLPRWGCMFMSLVTGAWLATENRPPTKDEVIRVYNDCRLDMTTRWIDGEAAGSVPILEMTNPLTFEITVNDPSRVIEKALSYVDNGWRGGQVPDAELLIPANQPRNYRLTWTLLNYRRSSADGHWVLGDRSGMNIIYNPDENLDIDWWSRAPKWRGIRVWRV